MKEEGFCRTELPLCEGFYVFAAAIAAAFACGGLSSSSHLSSSTHSYFSLLQRLLHRSLPMLTTFIISVVPVVATCTGTCVINTKLLQSHSLPKSASSSFTRDSFPLSAFYPFQSLRCTTHFSAATPVQVPYFCNSSPFSAPFGLITSTIASTCPSLLLAVSSSFFRLFPPVSFFSSTVGLLPSPSTTSSTSYTSVYPSSSTAFSEKSQRAPLPPFSSFYPKKSTTTSSKFLDCPPHITRAALVTRRAPAIVISPPLCSLVSSNQPHTAASPAAPGRTLSHLALVAIHGSMCRFAAPLPSASPVAVIRPSTEYLLFHHALPAAVSVYGTPLFSLLSTESSNRQSLALRRSACLYCSPVSTYMYDHPTSIACMFAQVKPSSHVNTITLSDRVTPVAPTEAGNSSSPFLGESSFCRRSSFCISARSVAIPFTFGFHINYRHGAFAAPDKNSQPSLNSAYAVTLVTWMPKEATSGKATLLLPRTLLLLRTSPRRHPTSITPSIRSSFCGIPTCSPSSLSFSGGTVHGMSPTHSTHRVVYKRQIAERSAIHGSTSSRKGSREHYSQERFTLNETCCSISTTPCSQLETPSSTTVCSDSDTERPSSSGGGDNTKCHTKSNGNSSPAAVLLFVSRTSSIIHVNCCSSNNMPFRINRNRCSSTVPRCHRNDNSGNTRLSHSISSRRMCGSSSRCITSATSTAFRSDSCNKVFCCGRTNSSTSEYCNTDTGGVPTAAARGGGVSVAGALEREIQRGIYVNVFFAERLQRNVHAMGTARRALSFKEGGLWSVIRKKAAERLMCSNIKTAEAVATVRRNWGRATTPWGMACSRSCGSLVAAVQQVPENEHPGETVAGVFWEASAADTPPDAQQERRRSHKVTRAGGIDKTTAALVEKTAIIERVTAAAGATEGDTARVADASTAGSYRRKTATAAAAGSAKAWNEFKAEALNKDNVLSVTARGTTAKSAIEVSPTDTTKASATDTDIVSQADYCLHHLEAPADIAEARSSTVRRNVRVSRGVKVHTEKGAPVTGAAADSISSSSPNAASVPPEPAAAPTADDAPPFISNSRGETAPADAAPAAAPNADALAAAAVPASVGATHTAGGRGVSRAGGTPHQQGRSFDEKRKSTARRRSEYLRRGKRFGAAAPPCVPAESERVDMELLQTLSGPLRVYVRHNPDATLLLTCHMDGNTTQKAFDLVLSHLRATLRVPGYRSGLGEAPVNLLLHYAGGRAAVQQRLLQALADLVLHRAKEDGAKLIGTPQLQGDEEELMQRLAPGKDFSLEIKCDTLPTVRFKTSYKGLQIRVPRPPYVKGLLFNKAEENLEKRHAVQVEYSDQSERYARPGDAVDVEVVRGWFETTAGTRGDEIPFHLIRGNVTVILDPDCNPEGSTELIRGLMSIRRGEVREVRVPLPFSVEEMLPFAMGMKSQQKKPQRPTHVEEAAAAAVPRRSRVSPTGFLEPQAQGDLAESAGEAISGLSLTGIPADATTQQQQAVIDKQEERLVQTILHVRCLAVKRCIPRKLDDAFYQSLCKETREEVKEKLETHGEALVEAASLRARRGAVAAALEDITILEAPETLIEQQARLTFQQHMRSKAMEGEDTRAMNTEEYYQDWKRENLRAVLRILKTAFTIKAILKQEQLEVDKQQLLQFVEETMMKVSNGVRREYPSQDPDVVTERALNLMESQLVYDFVAANANITYYIEERPLEATALHPGAEGNLAYALKAYPPGADIERYKQKEKDLLEENLKLHEESSKFYIDQDKYKRPPLL